MKKRALWILVAVIAAGALVLILVSKSSSKGRIKIDAGEAEATLRLRGGWSNSQLIKSKAEPVILRPGIYKPVRLSISMKQDGDSWLLYSGGPWGDLSTIRVRKDNTTVLELGQSFLIKPSISKSSSLVSIGLSIIGRAGEHYSAAIAKNGKRLPTPKLKIVDEAGNVLASGRFEYG
jgi:hypothetical protein